MATALRPWGVPTGLVALAAVSASLAVWPRGGRGGSTVSTRLGTPVLSVRRAPTALHEAVAHVRLAAGVDAALADPALGAARQRVCVRVDAGTRTLFQEGADRSLIPASNLKLLTGLAALQRLGPTTQFTTVVSASRRPVKGVVDGNLYLVGSGDPLIQTAAYNATLGDDALPDDGYTHLEELARAVIAEGITEVTGAVIGDESRYDTQRYVPTWKPGYVSDRAVGPLDALAVNDGFAGFAPPSPVPSPAPAVSAARSLSALLVAGGVVVRGEPAAGPTPRGAVDVGSVRSPPMSSIVGEMLRVSDNNTAELLTKELGRRFGAGGTTGAGVAVVRRTLVDAGLPVDQLTAVDGSGLDRSDRASCGLLLAALQYREGPGSDLVAGLPVAASTGTLRDRLVGTAAAGRLAAKTGSLDGVSALSGYVLGPAPLAFAVVVNGLPRDSLGPVLEDRVGAVMAAYPDAPPVSQLQPLPVQPAPGAGASTPGGRNP